MAPTGRRVALSDRVVDLDTGEIAGHGRLRPTERALLAYLADHLGSWVGVDALHAEVWGFGPAVTSRAAYTSVGRLRAQIEADPSSPRHLQGERHAGYRLVDATLVRGAAPTLGNLPEAAAIYGRDAELARILTTPRPTWTVVGPGGVGKSRLALEVARRAGAAGGAWFCDLHGATTELELDRALARVLPGSGTVAERVSALGDPVVVLDHVEDARLAADLVRRLEAGAPGARIVATSGEALGLRREQVLRLAPLPCDPGVALLIDRVAAAGGTLDPRDAHALWALVDGLPLALEIVAANVALVGPSAVAARLEAGDDLQARRGDAPDRHRSLDRALAGSLGRLAPPVRRTLAVLAVLDGPFRLATAERATGDAEAARHATELVERSLVASTPEGLLRLLPTVRAAVRRFDPIPADEVLDRMLAPTVELARAGGDPSPWRQVRVWAAASEPGLRQIVDRFRRRTDLAPDLAAGVAQLLVKEGAMRSVDPETLGAWIERALGRAPPAAVAAGLWIQRARLRSRAGQPDLALVDLEAAAAAADRAGATVLGLFATWNRGGDLAFAGRSVEAWAVADTLDRGAEVSPAEDRPLVRASAERLRALITGLAGDDSEVEHLRRAAALYRAGGRDDVANDTELEHARRLVDQGRLDEADLYLREPRPGGDPLRLAELVGVIRFHRGEGEALAAVAAATLARRPTTFRTEAASAHVALGTLMVRVGDPATGARLLEAAVRLPRREPYGPVYAAWCHAVLRLVADDPAGADVHLADARARAESRALTEWVQTVAVAQADRAWARGALDEAKAALRDGFDRSRPLSFGPAALLLAETALRLGDREHARALADQVDGARVTPVVRACAHAIRATCAAVERDPAAAERHLAHTVGVHGPGAGWLDVHRAWVRAGPAGRPAAVVVTAGPLDQALASAAAELVGPRPGWLDG
ncbi:MAG: winged helix-turn-helix domain-containing protein [Myxococcota bacterium]